MPSLSAEKAEPREEALINKVFPVKLESTEHPPLTALFRFYLSIENFVSTQIQTVATAGRISDTSTHWVG
jgi:hypothetical protein